MVQYSGEGEAFLARLLGKIPEPVLRQLLADTAEEQGYAGQLTTDGSPPRVKNGGIKYLIYIEHLHAGGNLNMGPSSENTGGDRISVGRDAKGTAMGRGAVAIFTSTVNQSSLDPDLKRVLIQAREALENAALDEADKGDATHALEELTREMQSPAPKASRLERLWGTIKAVAPTVASILSGAASMAKLVGG